MACEGNNFTFHLSFFFKYLWCSSTTFRAEWLCSIAAERLSYSSESKPPTFIAAEIPIFD
jgi:hypothetical protein